MLLLLLLSETTERDWKRRPNETGRAVALARDERKRLEELLLLLLSETTERYWKIQPKETRRYWKRQPKETRRYWKRRPKETRRAVAVDVVGDDRKRRPKETTER